MVFPRRTWDFSTRSAFLISESLASAGILKRFEGGERRGSSPTITSSSGASPPEELVSPPRPGDRGRARDSSLGLHQGRWPRTPTGGRGPGDSGTIRTLTRTFSAAEAPLPRHPTASTPSATANIRNSSSGHNSTLTIRNSSHGRSTLRPPAPPTDQGHRRDLKLNPLG